MSILKNISKKINTAWTDWFTNIYSTLFPSATSTVSNSMTHSRSANTSVDLTCPDTVNYDLAMALYYNTKSGYKLGAFFCHSIISLPLIFMGVPHFDIEIQKTKKQENYWRDRLNYYNDKYFMLKKEIQKITHITGTLAVFPWFDSKSGFVRWNFIKSKYISDIYINPDTQQLTGIVTSINYTFKWDNGIIYNFIEKKIYRKDKIITTRTGQIPEGIKSSEIRRNPTGILPVIFTNDKEVGKFEGHSEFEKILPIIKAYSQINIRAHEEAANMKAKLIQTVKNKADWLTANGYTDISEISIENNDFILNVEDEKTEIIVPTGLLENNLSLMKMDYHCLVETEGIPEIWWGLKSVGNHASSEQEAKVGLAYVAEKQEQSHNPYVDLATATINLDAMAYNQNPPEDVKITWNELNTLTEVERSQVFDNWCNGIQKLTTAHAITMEGVHALLLELTDNKITDNFEEFKKQVEEYGTLRSMLEQEYGGMRDFTEDNPDKPVDGKSERIQRNGVKKKYEKVI